MLQVSALSVKGSASEGNSLRHLVYRMFDDVDSPIRFHLKFVLVYG